MKLCKDCKYYVVGYGHIDLCAFDDTQKETDYVYGGIRVAASQAMRTKRPAQETRKSKTACGPDAKWFEPKDAK